MEAWWKRMLERRRNARGWDAPRQENGTVAGLRSLFEAARDDAPAPDGKLWEKLRPRLAAHDETAVRHSLPFVTTLATTGPRLAVGALGVLLLAAGLFWIQGTERRARVSPLPTNWTPSLDNPLNPLNPLQAIGHGLETQTGQELLRYVAYGSPDRETARQRR